MNRPGWPVGASEDETPIYLISVVAEVTGLHPQTLRQYDRLGLVTPGRASGRGRRYSAVDLMRLTRVVELTRDGINLEGVRRILQLEAEVAELRRQMERLDSVPSRAWLEEAVVADSLPYLPMPLPAPGSTALVVWRPKRGA